MIASIIAHVNLVMSLLLPLLLFRMTKSGYPVSAFVAPRGKSRYGNSKPCFRIKRAAAEAASLDLEAWQTELTVADLQGLVETAEEAARAAGSIIITANCCSIGYTAESTFGTSAELKANNIKDIVTVYDKQAQAVIEKVIRAAYPMHRFLGEEDVSAGAAASEAALLAALVLVREEKGSDDDFIWICDPIDGTANFATGLALSAVTMGVVYKGTPVVGVVYDPHRNEMFTAIKGRGAYLNTDSNSMNSKNNMKKDRRLQVTRAVTDVKDAIINAGCPADPNAFAASMRGVLALNGKSRGLRMIACSALTTAWIAAGRLTAHFGYDLSSWDLVAGALLIDEAGGLVTDLDGSPYQLQTRNMLCSNGLIVHDQILAILREADAVSFTRSDQ